MLWLWKRQSVLRLLSYLTKSKNYMYLGGHIKNRNEPITPSETKLRRRQTLYKGNVLHALKTSIITMLGF
jgi:hypothetical protein